jgi:hypothetical protein
VPERQPRPGRLRIGKALTTDVPLANMGRLPKGHYRATLVVVRSDGMESIPAELLFEIG